MDLQALVNGMSAQWQKERSETQMTLGDLIERLDEFSPDAQIEGFQNPHSYRGYYTDLAFEKVEGTRAASELVSMCRGAMGEVYEGYKGGDYQMGRNTPVWISDYGYTGMKILSIEDDGSVELGEDEF